MGRCVAEFLLISVLVFVSKTCATNLTESNSSSTVSATNNVTDSTSFSRVNNSSSVLPATSSTSVSSSNQQNVSQTSADNRTQVSNSSSSINDRTVSTGVLSPNETSSKKIEVSSNKTQTKITYELEHSPTSSTKDFIDEEDLPFEEILKFKRKCCPLNKRFVELDPCFTAVCEDIPEDAPTFYRFESFFSHNDVEMYGLRGDALLSSTPFHCDGSKPFSYLNVTVMPNGSMYFSEENDSGVIERLPFGEEDASYYCLDLEPGTVELVLYRCEARKESQPVAYKVMKMISAIFLTGFIVVYMMKPQLHTLHNRCLMRLMICLLAKCVLSLIFHMKFWKCGWVWVFQYATAAGTYFFYMATFCWTTVICYDIWAKISGKSMLENGQRLPVKKKIRKYSQYGWGVACLITVFAVFIDILVELSNSEWVHEDIISPEFASVGNYWMGSNKAMYVYFYGPLLSLNAINAVFFVQTLRTIVRVKKDNNNVFNKSECSRRHHQADMKWLSVFAKLYVLMGITWILDIVAFELSDPQHRNEVIFKVIEYSIDIFNICQGILIFFITMVTKETARTLSKTFSETIMRARGSLTNSKKQFAPDPSTIRDDACSSKERMPRHAVHVRWKPAAIKLILIKKNIQEFVQKPTLPK